MDYLILQLEEQSLTAARFDISGRAAVSTGAAVFEFGPELSLEDAVSRLAEGITGVPRIVLCLPINLCAQRKISLPLKDRRKAREVLPARLQGELALSVEELALDILPAGDGEYLAVWTRKSHVAQAIELLKGAGLEPRVVTALPYAWGGVPGVPEDGVVSDGTALAVITKRSVTYVQALDEDRAAEQVFATLSALQLSGMVTGAQPLYLFGKHADTLVAHEPLAATQVTLIPAPPDQGLLFKSENAFQQLASAYATALACHEGYGVDFRRGELAWKVDDAKLGLKVRMTFIMALLAIGMLLVSKGMQYRRAATDLASLNNSIAAIYREIFPGRPKAVDELSEIKGELRKQGGQQGRSLVLDALKRLAETKGTAINGIYEAEIEGSTVRIKGDARSTQSVNEYKASLANAMTGIEIGEIKSRPDGSVTFSLTGVLKEAQQ